jgi:uncharacterized membrane protein
MAKLEQTIVIHAPVEKVFNFMADPHNLPEVWPAMVEVRKVIANPNGGADFEWVYKMSGVKFEGASITTEYVKNKYNEVRSTKGIDSIFRWDYDSVAEGTRLHLEVEYKIPIPLIGKLAEALIVKQNEHEAHTMLHNLKDRMEIEVPMPA